MLVGGGAFKRKWPRGKWRKARGGSKHVKVSNTYMTGIDWLDLSKNYNHGTGNARSFEEGARGWDGGRLQSLLVCLYRQTVEWCVYACDCKSSPSGVKTMLTELVLARGRLDVASCYGLVAYLAQARQSLRTCCSLKVRN